MKNKKILFLRSAQSALNLKTYNIQSIGMGKAFCNLGYDFDFVTFNKKCKEDNITIFYDENGKVGRVIEKNRLRLFSWGISTSVLNKDFLNQYDLIICQEYYQIMTYLVSKRHKNVVMYSGPYWNLFMLKPISPIYDYLLTKKIDRNIKYKFVKSALAKQYLEQKGYSNVVNLGVALDYTCFDSQLEMEPETRNLVDFMSNNSCILYVGRLDANKNLSFLLNVFSNLLNYEENLKLVMIGKSAVTFSQRLIGKNNESYEQEVFSRYPSKVIDNIYRVKSINNAQLKYVYPKAKAFLLPSKKEIFGMVLLEAMYLGAPVVSSKNGGSSTLIKNEAFGIIVDEFDVEKWTNAVRKFLNNSTYREEVIENAKKLIQEEYNWNYLVKKMLGVVKDNNETDNN